MGRERMKSVELRMGLPRTLLRSAWPRVKPVLLLPCIPHPHCLPALLPAQPPSQLNWPSLALKSVFSPFSPQALLIRGPCTSCPGIHNHRCPQLGPLGADTNSDVITPGHVCPGVPDLTSYCPGFQLGVSVSLQPQHPSFNWETFGLIPVCRQPPALQLRLLLAPQPACRSSLALDCSPKANLWGRQIY